MRRFSDNRPLSTLRRLLYRLILWPLLLVQLHVVNAWADESASKVSVAAKVNGSVISVPDFQLELARIQRRKESSAKTADGAKPADLKREALENLISRELYFQESIKQKISIDASVIDREMEQLKGQFAGPVQFAENLQRIHMTEAMVREQVACGLAIRILIDRSVGKGVAVTDEEVKKYYEQHQEAFRQPPQVRLSHILVAVDAKLPGIDKNQAGDKISILRKRVMSGEDFAALAAAHSDCQSKKKGGDIGWFAPGQLPPELETAVAQLKVGEVSEIVEDRFGVHIIKVVERKAAFTSPFDDVRDKVLSLARQEKGFVMQQRYLKSLRDAAQVEILLYDAD
jgi:parvulin-like peptidyl-prolyl isomerase